VASRRLTEFSHGAGCACKLAPGELTNVIRRLAPDPHPNLLVGATTGDDAAVWQLDDTRAVVLTADFITPVVDDARDWGRVAATNAVSDIYAMGGRPLLAINLVAWNTAELTNDLLGDVLAGGLEVARANGFAVAGGHTVDDPEPKYGMAVVGEVHPDHMLTNTGLRNDDVLVLTKPLGVGVITTAIKRGECPYESQVAAIESMTRSNAIAARVALESGATGATDVTGFGLLGHLGRMALESRIDVEIDTSAVPFLPGAPALAAAGVVPGGSQRNLAHVEDRLSAAGVDPDIVTLLADAQTSGGLVFGAAAWAADAAVAALTASGHTAAVIGRCATGHGRMRLLP
jgi:selenide,water dikinase